MIRAIDRFVDYLDSGATRDLWPEDARAIVTELKNAGASDKVIKRFRSLRQRLDTSTEFEDIQIREDLLRLLRPYVSDSDLRAVDPAIWNLVHTYNVDEAWLHRAFTTDAITAKHAKGVYESLGRPLPRWLDPEFDREYKTQGLLRLMRIKEGSKEWDEALRDLEREEETD